MLRRLTSFGRMRASVSCWRRCPKGVQQGAVGRMPGQHRASDDLAISDHELPAVTGNIALLVAHHRARPGLRCSPAARCQHDSRGGSSPGRRPPRFPASAATAADFSLARCASGRALSPAASSRARYPLAACRSPRSGAAPAARLRPDCRPISVGLRARTCLPPITFGDSLRQRGTAAADPGGCRWATRPDRFGSRGSGGPSGRRRMSVSP